MDIESLPLDPVQMQEVRVLLAACKSIDALEAGDRRKGYEAAALYFLDITNKPCSWRKIQTKFLAWLDAGRTAIVLVDKRAKVFNPKKNFSGSPRFRNFLYELCTRNQRSSRRMFRELVAMWRASEVIPGYERYEGTRSGALPTGWTERNLYRLIPDKGTMNIVRKGVRACADQLPTLLSTRAGMRRGQEILWDDVWLDLEVIANNQVVRPLQLGALDMLTGRRICWGTKPRLRREDGTRLGLNDDEMRSLVVLYLYTVGYNPKGTTLVVENGTASISDSFGKHLTLVTGGAVTVERSGMIGQRQVLKGGYAGRRVGNPRHKAALESWHNILHNELGDLPGQCGHDRTEPESHWGERKEQEKMELAKKYMSPESEAMMMNLLLSFAELCALLPMRVARINERVDHKLEGWAACGFVVQEYRLDLASDNWQPLASVPAHARDAVLAVVQSGAGYLRERSMSPNEAWDSCDGKEEHKLVRITPSQACELMGQHMARIPRRKGSYFYVKDRNLSDDELVYETRVIKQAQGLEWEEELPPMGDYKLIINPYEHDQAFVIDARGICVGYAALVQRVARGNREAVKAAFGHASARRADMLQDSRVALANTEVQLMERRNHNAQVIGDAKAATQQVRIEDKRAHDAEMRQVRRLRKLSRAAAAIVSLDELPESGRRGLY